MITRDDPKEVQHLKSHLSGEFKVKDFGALHYFLGIEMAWSRKGIFISQKRHILDLLTEIGLSGARPAETPIEINYGLNDQDSRLLINARRYQRLIEKLMMRTSDLGVLSRPTRDVVGELDHSFGSSKGLTCYVTCPGYL